MKITSKELSRVCLSIGLGFLLSSAVSFANQTSDYLSSISLNIEQGINTHLVVLENVSGTNDVNAMNIQPQTSELSFDLNGFVSCIPDKDIAYDSAKAYFGPVSLFIDIITDTQALYDDSYNPSWEEGKGQMRIAESGNESPFIVPLNQIKQGHPAVRFDPIEELNKKLQQHLNGGGDKVSFYQQDHFINVQRTVSMAGWCRLKGSNTKKAGFASVPVELTVKYVGDPDLKVVATLNPQLGNNVPNQFNNEFDVALSDVQFQPNIPHHYGKCIPDADPEIQLNLSFANKQNSKGPGQINLRVVPNNNTYPYVGNYFYRSTQVNPETDSSITMTFPLTAMLSQQQYSEMAVSNNKVWNHNMKIQARYKPYGEVYGEWQDFDTGIFKHRCEPQIKINSPAEMGGYQNNGTGQTQPGPSRLSPVPVKPSLDKVQPMVPSDPTPVPSPGRIQTPEDEEEPQLRLKALPQ